MSLLLDALYKASKDKEKAAELSLALQPDLPAAHEVAPLAEPVLATEPSPDLPLELELPSMTVPKAAPDTSLELAPFLVQPSRQEPEPTSSPQASVAPPFPTLELTLEPRPDLAGQEAPQTQPAEPLLQPVEQTRIATMEWAPPVKQEELASTAADVHPDAAPLSEVDSAPVSISVTEPQSVLQATSEPVSEVVMPPEPTAPTQPETATLTKQSASTSKVPKVKQPSKIAQLLSRGSAQSTYAKKADPGQRRVLVLGVTAVVLMVFMAGLFLWQPGALHGLLSTSTITPTVPPETVTDPVASAEPAEASEASTVTDVQVVVNPEVDQPKAAVVNEPVAPALTAASQTPPKAPVFRPGNTQPVVIARTPPNPLEVAYTALQEGRIDVAQQSYAAVLRNNPNEVNALLGMAYIAHQQGQREQALDYYQRVLRHDPSNTLAMAAVLELDARIDSTTARLKAQDLAERQPDSVAALSQAAHTLVAQGRVAEAIPMFARAQWLEPSNPLHGYNHAVALDRLGKTQQALVQYQNVLQIAEKAPSIQVRPFSVDAVRQRVAELTSSIVVNGEVRP